MLGTVPPKFAGTHRISRHRQHPFVETYVDTLTIYRRVSLRKAGGRQGYAQLREC
jgi:hypothetical protein